MREVEAFVLTYVHLNSLEVLVFLLKIKKMRKPTLAINKEKLCIIQT